MTGDKLRPPEPLDDDHDLRGFDCGEPSLDDWLRRQALRSHQRGAARTYVLCEENSRRVVAYYCLAVGAVSRREAPGRVRRNMPDPVPVMVLGRMAVDRSRQGHGVGSALLRDAVLRTLHAAEIAGIRAMLVHTLNERARQFYEQHGFHPSPVEAMTLMIPLAEAKRALGIGNG